MKSNISRIAAALLSLALLLSFAPTAWAEGELGPDPEDIPVTEVSLNPTELELEVGKLETLIATVEPAGATNQKVTWSSGNENVARVDDGGYVIAVGVGTATITATAVADPSKKAECTVTVTAPIPVEEITLPRNLILSVGKSTQLEAEFKPSNATNKNVGWMSDDKTGAVIEVSTNGKITAKGPGKATVTVMTDDGNKTADCTIIVISAISPSSASVQVGSTVKLSLSNLPENASIQWTSNSSNAVLSGDTKTSSVTVDGKAADRATITATITVGEAETTLTCTVTVTAASVPVTGVSLNKSSLSLAVGDTETLKASITPSNATNQNLTWETTKSSVATVDANGKVTAKGEGKATITVTTKDGSKTASCSVTVSENDATVTYRIEKNKTVTFSASDFNKISTNETGKNLDFVTFTLPSSSKGVLYYDYSGSSTSNDAVKKSTECYRSPGSKQIGISDITFVPANNYTGTVSIPFTGEDVNGKSISGTVVIRVGTGGGDVNYSADPGKNIDFLASDFNDFCRDEINETLSFIKFTNPSSNKGTLYVNYRSGNKNNEEVGKSTKYYRSPSSSQSGISDITFVPNSSSVTGTISFDFTGESTGGKEISGTVVLSYKALGNASAISYNSTNGQAVAFQTNDFKKACDNRGGAALKSVKFAQPSTSVGTLYYSYVAPGNYGGVLSSATSYGTGSGSGAISNVSFVPVVGFSGTATLSYTGTDEDGESYTGTVYIYVTSALGIFTDMGKHSWAADAVSYLYQNDIVKGLSANSYGPADLLRRGDFVLMLSRAFHFTGTPAEAFRDVPSDAYYAIDLHAAKAMGIALGDQGNFRPNESLTRQDAMVLIKRSLDVKGKTLEASTSLTLSAFPDAGAVSPYAKDAVSALVAAGIVTGDNYGKLNPLSTLTRAEMAVMLYRVLTL